MRVKARIGKIDKNLKQLITFLLHSLLLAALSACQTAAASVPMLTVREATNCRTGPGEAYDIVFTYSAGTNLEIAGRYEPGNFWLVKSDESPTGVCWMWGEYVDVSGNYLAVSNVTPPPTAANAPSGTLSIEKWEYACSDGTLTFTVTWKDRTTDEAGYRIFRNGELLAELPASSTMYIDIFNVSAGESVEYYLQAFGPGWTMNSSVMRTSC